MGTSIWNWLYLILVQDVWHLDGLHLGWVKLVWIELVWVGKTRYRQRCRCHCNVTHWTCWCCIHPVRCPSLKDELYKVLRFLMIMETLSQSELSESAYQNPKLKNLTWLEICSWVDVEWLLNVLDKSRVTFRFAKIKFFCRWSLPAYPYKFKFSNTYKKLKYFSFE